jgi:hypothetical protein
MPLPVVIVAAVPLLSVRVKLSDGRSVLVFATAVEEKEAVLARFVTTTEVFPATVPGDAVAVTTLLLEEATALSDSGPVRLLSDCMSLLRLVVSVLICVIAAVWLASSVICAFQILSGPSAAVTAELTADVTSSPGVDAPIAASRMELISTDVAEFDEPSNELNKELVLISGALSSCP